MDTEVAGIGGNEVSGGAMGSGARPLPLRPANRLPNRVKMDHSQQEAAQLAGDEIVKEILEYLQYSMLKAVYGDFLSSYRTERYEPRWPMEFDESEEPPLAEPEGQEEANTIFDQLIHPFRGWYKPPDGSKTMVEVRSQRERIVAFLRYHRDQRTIKPEPESHSGNFLLYRNLPDSVLEANVWSLINAAHVAVRRKAWSLAERYVNRAMITAKKLSYKPLLARCWYWRGRIADEAGDRTNAADCFLEAMHCIGVYEEGELLWKMMREYKRELLQLLDEQEDQQGEDDWSLQVREAILSVDSSDQPLEDLPPSPLVNPVLREISLEDGLEVDGTAELTPDPEPWLEKDGAIVESPQEYSPAADAPVYSTGSLWVSRVPPKSPARNHLEYFFKHKATLMTNPLTGTNSQPPPEGIVRSSRELSSTDDPMESTSSSSSSELQMRKKRTVTGLPEPFDEPSLQELIGLTLGAELRLAEEEASTSPREDSSEDEMLGSINVASLSPVQRTSPTEHIDDLLNELSRDSEPEWNDYAPARPRDIDWTLVDELEAAAQNSTGVEKEMIYRLCEGLSTSFEESIRDEEFQDGFDNYPDLEESIAWKVLRYTRTKARLTRPTGMEPSPQNVGVGAIDDSTESYAQPPPASPTGDDSTLVVEPVEKQPAPLRRRPTTEMDKARPNVPPIAGQTRADVVMQAQRVATTAEEKIAAYKQTLLNREDDRLRKSSRRLEVEKDPDWVMTIKRQEAEFPQLVKDHMAKTNAGVLNARVAVRAKHQELLRELWGEEGVRPLTPSPTRRERAQYRKELNARLLTFFKAQVACMTYRRKYASYKRLPEERRMKTACPIEPSSSIAWLVEHRDTTKTLLKEQQEKTRRMLEEHAERKRVLQEQQRDKRRSVLREHTQSARSRLDQIRHENNSRYPNTAPGQDHAKLLVPPLRPHSRPTQISHSSYRGDSAESRASARSNSNASSNGTLGSVPSNASTTVYEVMKSRLDERIDRELEAQIAMDAMLDAMERARLRDEVFSTDRLVDIAEAAVSDAANTSDEEEDDDDQEGNVGSETDSEVGAEAVDDDEEDIELTDRNTIGPPRPLHVGGTRKRRVNFQIPEFTRESFDDADDAEGEWAEEDEDGDDEDEDSADVSSHDGLTRGISPIRTGFGDRASLMKETETAMKPLRPEPGLSRPKQQWTAGAGMQKALQAVGWQGEAEQDESADEEEEESADEEEEEEDEDDDEDEDKEVASSPAYDDPPRGRSRTRRYLNGIGNSQVQYVKGIESPKRTTHQPPHSGPAPNPAQPTMQWAPAGDGMRKALEAVGWKGTVVEDDQRADEEAKEEDDDDNNNEEELLGEAEEDEDEDNGLVDDSPGGRSPAPRDAGTGHVSASFIKTGDSLMRGERSTADSGSKGVEDQSAEEAEEEEEEEEGEENRG